MGTRKTQHPAIPSPADDNLVEVAQAIKESLEIGRTDRRGDPLDRWVTIRDLVDGGVVVYLDESTTNIGGPGSQIGGGSGGPIIGGDPGPGGTFLIPPDPSVIKPVPRRPANVRATGLWDSIIVQWDWPSERGGSVDWLGAEIWASATINFSQGSKIGISTSNFFVHENTGLIGNPGSVSGFQPGVWYYWVRWFGRTNDDISSNVSKWNPYHYLPGVRGQGAVDPSYVINILSQQISESQINQSLNTRINLIDYDADGNQYFDPVQDRILAATISASDDIYAAIAQYAGVSVSETEIRADYNIRLDLNGYIVGFGLSAMASIDAAGVTFGETSTFLIKADRFAVGFPGEGNIFPFVVGMVDGVSTVAVDGQLVVDGSITARSIQANSIGANQINAASIWAGIVTAERVFGSTFATGPSPQTRLEINGVGTSNELYPLWYGSGDTSGVSSLSSQPIFFADSLGNLKLAGDLIVTGAGKFFLGSNDVGEYRLELGDSDDGYILWAGTGTKTTDPESDNWIFYIDNSGQAKFKGTVEADFVSGEISRTLVVNQSQVFNLPDDAGSDQYGAFQTIWTGILPGPPFASGHIPYASLSFDVYGTNVRGAGARIQMKVGAGPWQTINQHTVDISEYSNMFTMNASISRVFGPTEVRFQMSDFDNRFDPPITSKLNGIVMGIR